MKRLTEKMSNPCRLSRKQLSGLEVLSKGDSRGWEEAVRGNWVSPPLSSTPGLWRLALREAGHQPSQCTLAPCMERSQELQAREEVVVWQALSLPLARVSLEARRTLVA